MSVTRIRTAIAFALAIGWATGALAQVPAPAAWTISEPFAHDDKARTNLSGAACAPTRPPFKSCLIVNDEKKYAQFFAIDGTRLVPGAVIRLVHKDAESDPDAEGAAFDAGYFYATGSHGRARNPDKNSEPSYRVFRFPVGKAGKPAFEVSEDDIVGVQASSRLREAIKRGQWIGKFHDQPLDQNGINIEGIAVKNGRAYFGLRGPSVDGHAFILSVDANALFSRHRKLNARVHRLKLGDFAGIRDLAAVRGGLLVLRGSVNDQAVAPAIYHWNEKTGALTPLGDLQLPQTLPSGAKAETLLVLRDAKGEPWRVLLMFDGPENGAPTEYELAR